MKKLLKKIIKRLYIDKNTWQFIKHNKKKWASREKNSVILIDLFDFNPLIYCFSHIANHLADKNDSSIAAYHLTRSFFTEHGLPERRLKKIYESFGAHLNLTLNSAEEKKYQKDADEFAHKVFNGLQSKWDLINLSLEGIKIGDLIYDTYLKTGHFTVQLKDPKLFSNIRDAYIIYQICKKYFSEKKVKAVFTSHAVYISHGILVRLAMAENIPVYNILDFDNLVLVKFSPETCYHHAYHLYDEIFKTLSKDEKTEGCKQAREILSQRMLGKVDKGIADMLLEEGRPGHIGYGEISTNRLLKETGRPRVLVMLNCFFDAPHCYRNMLFPDFWEWICFVLTKAEQTPFDWYVKPHPGGLLENDEVITKLRKMFPKVNYLERSASNRQILHEGINSMFTVFGTAAHEFAYVGVPVVTAGDNPHIKYDFNLHPQTISEYEKLILNADKIKMDIDKSKIEEFFYMHYIYPYKIHHYSTRLIDEKYEYQRLGYKVNDPSLLTSYLNTETPEKLTKLESYLNHYFSKPRTDFTL